MILTPLLLIAIIDVDKLGYRSLKIETQSNNNCKPFWADKDDDNEDADDKTGKIKSTTIVIMKQRQHSISEDISSLHTIVT